eukprot:2359961-Rhodomonas_salina.2
MPRSFLWHGGCGVKHPSWRAEDSRMPGLVPGYPGRPRAGTRIPSNSSRECIGIPQGMHTGYPGHGVSRVGIPVPRCIPGSTSSSGTAECHCSLVPRVPVPARADEQ